jgi:hypothetical protein
MLRLVFPLALRQAEGFTTSVLRLLGQDLRVPDHTTLSRLPAQQGEVAMATEVLNRMIRVAKPLSTRTA